MVIIAGGRKAQSMNQILHKFLVCIYLNLVHAFQTIQGLQILITEGKSWNTGKKKAVVIGTPEHDNIGDHAIALAEEQFISHYFGSYDILEVPIDRWRSYKFTMCRHIKPNDLVFITGGGNLGSIYLEDEKLKRYVVSHFRSNRITIFPQTAYYSDTREGKNELNKTRAVFGKHDKLLICARENKSYEYIQDAFPSNEHICCPDMVFFLTTKVDSNLRKDVGICFRADAESSIGSVVTEDIELEVSQRFTIKHFYTAGQKKISYMDREQAVTSILQEVSGFELVITDRLHGMIFAIITNTPCFVLPVISPKITSMLEWPEVQGSAYMYTTDAIKHYGELDWKKWERETMLQYFDALALKVDNEG